MLYRILPNITEYASHWRVQLDIPGFHPIIKIDKESLRAPMSGKTYIIKIGDYVYLDNNRMMKFLIPADSMWNIGSM